MKFVLPSLAALSLATLPAISQTTAPAPAPAPAAPAPATTAPAGVDQSKIRSEVEALLAFRVQARVNTRNAALQEVQKRSQFGNSAVDFYADAYKEVTFAGKPTGGQEKMEWTKKNGAVLQSPELKAAAQLYLKYLALTIQRSGSDKPMDFVAPSVDYVREFADDTTKLFARQEAPSEFQKQLLSGPLRDNPIIKANGWQALIKDFPDWEMNPGNLDGIFEKNIFTPLRAAKDARLIDAWKMRMDLADRAAVAQKLDSKKSEFTDIQFPNWRVARAEDLLILGKKDEAINEIYLVLQHYPNHPSFEKWGQRLLQILAPAPAAPQN